MFGPLPESLETKIGSELDQPLASQAVADMAQCANCDVTYPAPFSVMFGPLPPLPPLTESLETKIGSELDQPLASQAVADMAQCATCDVTYPALFSVMFGPLPPSPPLTESLETKIGSELDQPLASQAVADMAQCATCDMTYPALFSVMFGPLPPSPPLTESLETKISSEFHQPLASQAVADMAKCATCDVTYPTLFSVMFGPLPPSPPLTESLETKISSEFHQPLASQAVADMAKCATCDMTYPALFSVMFGPLPPSPPLTESLETKISSEFHQPLASQAVADMAKCATCDVTYPTLFSVMFSPLPPLPPLTESLETKIGSEFHQPLASQAVADMAQCATCDVTYRPLFSIMFNPLPPSPPLTESLETKISSEFHQPLASQAVADMAQCATCDMT
ncbi:hypothetical protein C8J55DRAFT_494245 [Lentinula edodes]|uniref:Uncharacterized protein n=1 Tax=Lentinula lateritia TaxID=40482 RepID=A0A9W8ZQA8_9AGAR|nr:hypothetical protein C8J55DRAFT_494245 [Lentinula edodes]